MRHNAREIILKENYSIIINIVYKYYYETSYSASSVQQWWRYYFYYYNRWRNIGNWWKRRSEYVIWLININLTDTHTWRVMCKLYTQINRFFDPRKSGIQTSNSTMELKIDATLFTFLSGNLNFFLWRNTTFFPMQQVWIHRKFW